METLLRHAIVSKEAMQNYGTLENLEDMILTFVCMLIIMEDLRSPFTHIIGDG